MSTNSSAFDTTDEAPTRRDVLQRLGQGVAVALAGLSGTGAASARGPHNPGPRDDVASAYRNLGAVRRAIRTTAAVLLEDLAERGLLDGPTVASLGVGGILEPAEYAARAEGVTVLAVGDDPAQGTYTPEILVRRQTDRGKLHLGIKPEKGVALATLDDGPLVSSRGGTVEVTPQHTTCIEGNGCYVAGSCGCFLRPVSCCNDGHCWWGDLGVVVDCDQYTCDGYCDCACGFDDYPACDECG